MVVVRSGSVIETGFLGGQEQVSAQEDILRRIESAGYRVTGYRDAIGDGQDGPLILTAVDAATGERYAVEVYTKEIDGEIEALRKLGEKIGIRVNRDV